MPRNSEFHDCVHHGECYGENPDAAIHKTVHNSLHLPRNVTQA
jgi:hypothetical protein